jgi:hypothetical protein
MPARREVKEEYTKTADSLEKVPIYQILFQWLSNHFINGESLAEFKLLEIVTIALSSESQSDAGFHEDHESGSHPIRI